MPQIILIFLALIFTSCRAQGGRDRPGDKLKSTTALTQDTPADFPQPLGYVNDYVTLLDSAERMHLEQKLSAFDSATTNQIVIVIIDSDTLTVEQFDAYTLALSNFWGVGVKGKNNGLSIVLSPKLRKIRINTSTGIEHILTDEICGKVIKEIIVPEFKQGNYFEGLDEATGELIRNWKQ